MMRPVIPGEDWTTIEGIVRKYEGVSPVRYVPAGNTFELAAEKIDVPGFQYCHLNIKLDDREYVVRTYPLLPSGERDAERDFRKYCRLIEQGRAEIELSGEKARIVESPKKKKNK